MTREEFENEFDILYNSITSNQAPGLDIYEKSVFLTNAQDDIVKSYFDPRLNKVQEGYDDSQRRQIDFSMITVVDSYTNTGGRFQEALYDPRPNSKSIQAVNALMVLNERLLVSRENKDVFLTVIPVTFTEYDRLMSKPYKRPLKWQAWRIFNTNDKNINTSDLVVGPVDEIKQYVIRYIRKPRPIILGNLDGLTINNYYYKEDDESANEEGAINLFGTQACELDPILHKEVLQRAVELAKAAYAGDLNSQIILGQASQTELGVVQSSK